MHLGNGIICPVTGIPMLAIAGVSEKSKKRFQKRKHSAGCSVDSFCLCSAND